MSPENRYIAEMQFYVRYVETDAMGIVHHTSYIVYFEEARSHYARERGSDYATFERSGFYLAVTEVNARYVKPARYGDQLRIRVWIETMRSRTATFGYEITGVQTGEVCVTGTTKHICITHDGQVAMMPALWRAWA